MTNSWIRWGSALFGGFFVSLLSFWFMQLMIMSDGSGIGEKSMYKMVEFIASNEEIQKPDETEDLPPEPEEVQETPDIPEVAQETESVQTNIASNSVNLGMPSLSGGFSVGGGAPQSMGKMEALKMDSALVPLVQIKPVYPSRQKRMGVEGYVKVRLNVNESGDVVNIEILEAKPKGAFDKSVKKALKRWKFRPKTVNGVATSQTGELKLDFKLEEN